MQKFKRIVMISALVSGSLLIQGCNFLDWLIGPPCDSCYSGGGYDSDDSDFDSGSSSSDDRVPNPPRFEPGPTDPGRAEEISNGRDRERENRGRNSVGNTTMDYKIGRHVELMSATQNLVKKYDMKPRAAMILAEHIIKARTGGMHTILELGITKAEINAMVIGENPSANVLKTMARILGMDIVESHELIQKIKSDIQYKHGF